METESILMVARGWGHGEWGRTANGHRISLCRAEMFWNK